MMAAPSVASTTPAVTMKMVGIFYFDVFKDKQIFVFRVAESNFEEGNILIMGGFYAKEVDDVSLLSLNESLDCPSQTRLPFEGEEMIAVVDSQGRPLACGGTGQASNACVVYEDGQWVAGPSMIYPRDFGPDSIRLSDGRWWISGNNDEPG